METDGVPEETIGYNYTAPKNSSNTSYKDTDPRGLGSTNLTPTDATDPVSGNPSTGGELGCTKLKTVADQAKTLGITVIMVGDGRATPGGPCHPRSPGGGGRDRATAGGGFPVVAGPRSRQTGDSSKRHRSCVFTLFSTS